MNENIPKLTDEQKQSYLKNPYNCPFCNKPDFLFASSFSYETKDLTRKMTCELCNNTFLEVFSFKGIIDDE